MRYFEDFFQSEVQNGGAWKRVKVLRQSGSQAWVMQASGQGTSLSIPVRDTQLRY